MRPTGLWLRSLGPALLGGVLGAAPLACTHGASGPVSEAVAERDALLGVAANAKGGAVLELDDQRVVYLQGLEAWPDGVDGLRVQARGALRGAARLPRAKQSPDGAWSQGVDAASGPELWLDAPEWGLAGVAATPWTLRVADGSGNITTLVAEGPAGATWRYDPVTPAESSSGVYSGGARASGTLGAAQVSALWAALNTLAGDTGAQIGQRVKGSVAVDLESPGGKRHYLFSQSAAAALEALLRALR